MEEFLIHGYRGMNNMHFKLGDITIFTGDNGLGKTTTTDLIYFLRRNNRVNNIKTSLISNGDKKFTIFHTFNNDFRDKKIKDFENKGYEFYSFHEKNGYLNIVEYATMRGNELILFWHNPGSWLKYTIIDNFKFNSIKKGNTAIKKLLKEEEKNAKIIPWPKNLSEPILFSELFSAFRWLSEQEDDIIWKILKNSPKIEFDDLEGKKNKEEAELILDYILAVLNESINRIYLVPSSIIKKQNRDWSLFTNKAASSDPILSYLTNKDNLKSFNEFLKNASMPNPLEHEKIKTGTGIYNHLFFKLKNSSVNFNMAGDGVQAITPFYVGLKSQPLPMIREPELHMHPKAISEFGSEIFRIKKKIIVETHSQFLIDRIRFEKSKSKLKRLVVINTLFIKNDNKSNEIIEIGSDGRFFGANKYMEFIEDETLKWFK